MWLLVLLGANLYASARGDAVVRPVFHKCCLKDQGLIRIVEAENETQYECLDGQNIEHLYNVSKFPLIVGDDVPVEYGNLNKTCVMNLVSQTPEEVGIKLSTTRDVCYDRLMLEIVVKNISLISDVSKIVSLSFVRNESDMQLNQNLTLNRIRKCCPKEQSYDVADHLCKRSAKFISEKSFLKRLNVSSGSIYELETGVNCKKDQYAIELSEELYSLNFDGSILVATKRYGVGGGTALQGEWCVEQQYGRDGLVARVCSRDCEGYGAFCVRKCCPIGMHFYKHYKGRQRCVSDDDMPFNISLYLDPLKDYGVKGDVLGIREGLSCSNSRMLLNHSLPQDRHKLNQYGLMHSIYGTNDEYCFETFDNEQNKNADDHDIFFTAVICFVAAPKSGKDFKISFWLLSISSVCLALTLVVYCLLPELQNLHGLTLICHVSMMLLAFSCLARVQHSPKPDKQLCALLGYAIYFGFTAAFAWLNVMCFDIWRTFGSMRTIQPMRKAGAERRRFIWYSLYAWSITISLTLIMFLLDKYPVSMYLDADIGRDMCWFGSIQNTITDWPHYIFFVIPMGLATCINFVLFLVTSRHCAKVKSEVNQLQAGPDGDHAKRRFRVDRAIFVLTGKLWVVMGAGWVVELASTLITHPEWLWLIADFINSLQGVFIFLILIFKPKLYYLIKKRLGMEKPDAQKQASSGRTSSTFLYRTIKSDERATMRISQENDNKLP